MANKYNIPDWLEKKVRSRDKRCVYCNVKFNKDNFRDWASLEHIDNDENNISEINIVMCCRSCNSSKGTKTLQDWFDSTYCNKKKIDSSSVAKIIRTYMRKSKQSQQS